MCGLDAAIHRAFKMLVVVSAKEEGAVQPDKANVGCEVNEDRVDQKLLSA